MNCFLEIEGLEVNIVELDFYFFDFNSKLSFNFIEKDVIVFLFYIGVDYLVEFNDICLERGMELIIFIELDVDENRDWGNMGFSSKWLC